MTDGTANAPLSDDGNEPTLSCELIARLAGSALDVFRRLPVRDQKNFIRWVSAGVSQAERARRAAILGDAMNQSPLAWESRPSLPNNPG